MSEGQDNVNPDRFPLTHLSAVVASASVDPAERARGFEALVAAYWMPIYKYIRIKWGKSSEDAKDLTQGFFTEAIEKNFFGRYDPSKARFRTFVRTCLDGFVSNQHKAATRLKRGGDTVIVTLDFDEAESQLQSVSPGASNAIEEFFEKEWARSIFALSVENLRSELADAGKTTHFELFERFVLADADDSARPSYKELAAEFGLSITDVTNYLAYARREFRGSVLAKLRDLTASDEEYRREARALLGVDV